MSIINRIQVIINVWIQNSTSNQVKVQNFGGSAPSTDEIFWMLLGLGVGSHHDHCIHHVETNSDIGMSHSEYSDFDHFG